MKKYNLKDILIPFICLLIILGLIAYTFLNILNIFSTYDKTSQYTENVSIYQNNIVKLQGISQTNVNEKLTKYNKSIPVGGEVATLVNDTLNLAKSFGLDAERDVTNTTQTTTNDNNKVKKAVDVEELKSGDLEFVPDNILINGLVYPINLSLIVKGTKENILSFIQSVSKQERILNIQQVDLTKSPTSDTDNFWIGKISLYAYTVAEQKTTFVKTKKIINPLDTSLLLKPKNINTNF